MASESARLTRLGPGAAEPERGASPPAAEAAAPAPAVEEVPEVRARLRSGILAGLFTLAMFYTFYFAKAVLIPIALAMLLNLLLAPVVRGLKRYLRLPTGVGAALVLLLGVAVVAGSIYGLSGPATRWVNELPIAMINLRLKLEELREPVAEVQEAAQRVEKLAQGAPNPDEQQPVKVAVAGPGLTQTILGGAVSFVTGAVVMIALLFFLLASGDTLLRQAVSIAPRLSDKRRVVEIARDTEDDISYYLLTVSLINAGLGVAVGVAMFLLGMPNALLWGVMAGIFNFVPFLGAVVGISTVALVALLTFDQLWSIVLPPLTYLFLTSFEAQFVTPALLARRLTLNPVAVFLALIVWTWLWGVAGALLAVPLLATFKICCDHIEPLQPIGTMLGR
ncbi:MAG TPA: AI-2E family transporter [Geminicoccaceae bacterium]|nr:AI-2E family transporter [Geminicoccaceae bacterium]